MISIVIPARNETYLNKTLEDLFIKARGEIEVIVTLDGYWPSPIISNKNIKYIHRGEARGMRAAINSAVATSKGDYILKTDAHCMFDEGFDVKLVEDCQPNWVVVPRRKRLNPETWQLTETDKPDVDYMYIAYPKNLDDPATYGLNGEKWEEKNRSAELKKVLIDDLMTSQGSCWFMPRKYYDFLELMDEEHYGMFWNEFQEIGFKAWLSGGRVVVNKKTWYAHWHKDKRGYALDRSSQPAALAYTRKWMTNEAWPKQTIDFKWLIQHFSPVPGWENYKT